MEQTNYAIAFSFSVGMRTVIEQMTDTEVSVMRMQFRTTILYQYLGWDSYFRRIGQVLLSSMPGDGATIHGISRLARIPRKTVRRKLAAMMDNGLVQKDEGGLYSHTPLGRSMHIRTWRDINKVARGDQTGLSSWVIQQLKSMPKFGPYDYAYLHDVKFDKSAAMDLSPAAKIRRSPVPSCV